MRLSVLCDLVLVRAAPCLPCLLALYQVAHYAQGFGMNVIAFDDPVPEADLKAVAIEKVRHPAAIVVVMCGTCSG
jgi:hypothetical protein